jgi:ABC-type sugar transport system permease subunit
MWCVIAVAVWTGTPFYTMSFLAGLQAIPNELYEAARLDGASALQEFRYVTLPGMQAVFLVTVMLSTVFTSTSLVVVNILTNGAPAERTNILPNFSFNLAMGTGRLGIASAVNMIFFPLLVLVILGLSRRLLAARELTGWRRRRARGSSGARGGSPPTRSSRCSSCGPWGRSTGW